MQRSTQTQQQDLFHFFATTLCGSIVTEIVNRSMNESQSALFYRREIERCQEYISLMQAEATHTWEPPSKPEELENIEDVEFFQSEFCLKNKLNTLQDDRQKEEEKHKVSQHSRNNLIRGSIKSRMSSISAFSWSEQKYNTFKLQNENKLKQKKGSRQLSLQKLAISKKEVVTQTEKQLRSAIFSNHIINEPIAKKKTYRKMIFRKKEQQNAQDDGNIPMLVELAYNVTNQFKLKNLQRKESLPKLEQTQKKLEEMQNRQGSKGQKKRQKLVINDYDPNKNHIKVNSWRKFNQLIEGTPQQLLPNHQEFIDIHYFTEVALQ